MFEFVDDIYDDADDVGDNDEDDDDDNNNDDWQKWDGQK